MRTTSGTVCLWIALSALAATQTPNGTSSVEVRAGEQPIEGAEVVVHGTTHRTDGAGEVTIAAPSGALGVTVAKEGFVPTTVTIQVPVSGVQRVQVDLQITSAKAASSPARGAAPSLHST